MHVHVSYIRRTFNMLTFSCAIVKCFFDDSPLKNWLVSTLRISALLSGEGDYSVLSITQFGIYMCTHIPMWNYELNLGNGM